MRYTPLDIAAKNGHAAVVEALLKGGARANETNTYGTTPLMLAAASGSADAVTALLNAGADVNAKESVKGETALMLAAAFGRADAARVLLADGPTGGRRVTMSMAQGGAAEPEHLAVF